MTFYENIFENPFVNCTIKDVLSVCLLNVNGNLKDKLERDDFKHDFASYDLIFYSETWSCPSYKLELEGYDKIVKHRKKLQRAKRYSGGLCIFVKKNISKGVAEICWENFEDGTVLKLDKTFFGFEEDLFLICTYMKPKSSSRRKVDPDSEPYDKLLDKIAELSPLGEIMLMGDLNSRTYGLIDFSPPDENEFDLDSDDKNLTLNDLQENDLSLERASQDKGTNEYGHTLTALCRAASLLILNGRFSRDKNVGKITYLETRKNKIFKSIVDYIICSKNILYQLLNFEVKDTNAYSDHAVLCVDIRCKIFSRKEHIIENVNNSKRKPKWKEEFKEEYTDFLNTEQAKIQLSNIIRNIDEAEIIDDNIIDQSVMNLCDVLKEAGNSHFVIFKSINSTKNPKNEQNLWYDSDCKEKKLIFDGYEKIYRETLKDEDRIIMCNARNNYRKLCRYKRKKFQIERANELLTISKTNPRMFWRKMRKKKTAIGSCDFNSYFKTLFDIQPEIEISDETLNNVRNEQNFNVDYLNNCITMNELVNAIKKLKNNKACGFDGILNEFLKNSNLEVRNVLLKIFNVILESGIFPSEWTIGEIVPVFKKGNINDPSNYRAITLISCVGKLFTFIINEKLNIFAESNNIFSENQFGFRRDKSTVDCLFILHGLIEHFLNNSKSFYCSFVDLTRAFDGLERNVLWYKLIKSGISCKMVNLMKNMYSKIKICVKDTFQNLTGSNNNPHSQNYENLSDMNQRDKDYFFTSKAGVFQGESLSPFLFSMYVNDFSKFLEDDGLGIDIGNIIFTSLLFADDMAIVSKTREGLQAGLVSLKQYCDNWGLTVNRGKTKCVVFKKGGLIGKKDIFYYDGEQIETVNSFKYLGFVFGSSGKFAKGINAILEQSNKALFGMKSLQYMYPELQPKTQLHLFNTLVKPVLNNSSEIWGFCEAEKLERLHLGFLKYILNIRKSTPSDFVYKELNVFPLIVTRYFRIFNFWLKVISSPDKSFVKCVYTLLCNDIQDDQDNVATNWASLVKTMLHKFGLGFLWYNQNYLRRDDTYIINLFQQRIKDHFWQQINGNINNLSKNRLYTHLNIKCTNNNYLFTIKEKYIRFAITKIRIGSHNLMIERGRWSKLELIDRQCSTCFKLEDEYHVIVECPLYHNIRKTFLPKYLYCNPSMFKLIEFIDSAKGIELRNFGIYCHKICKYYNENII